MIEERIITCINLFNGYNEIEKFFNKLVEITLKSENLNEEDFNKLKNIKNTSQLTKEEKESEWYKLSEEWSSIEMPPTDYFQKMIISLSALFISLYKESIIDKDYNKNLSILVDTPSYQELLKHFCTKKDNKYYIGELEFVSPLECLDFIRNKLLHGDYHIKDNYIYFKKDGKLGNIIFSNLINYCLLLEDLSKCKNKEFEDSMVLCENFYIESPIKRLAMEERMYYVDFKIKVKGTRIINSTIINLLKKIENLAHYYNIKCGECVALSVELAIKSQEDELKKNKCIIEYDIDKYIYKPGAKEVIKRFIKEYKKEEHKEKINLNEMVNYLSTNSFVNKRDILDESFRSLTYHLLKSMPNAVCNEIKDDARNEWFDVFYSGELPFYILKFYCYFNYGLDKIHSSAQDTLLRDILEGKKFDYSQLDLSLFDDPNMTSDITINNYNDQYQGITNEYNKKEAAYKKALQDYNNYIAKSNPPIPAVEAKLLSIVQTWKDSFDIIKDLKDKADKFDLNKYTKNLNIINHLRNSIAHGNYELDDSDIDNKYFIFNDIYNGVNTYSLKIKCDDFSKLFDSRTIIHDYLDKLSRVHLGKSMDRIHKEELLLDSTYVKDDYISSWNSLVISILDSNDENKIRNVMLSYLCMKEIHNPSVYINDKDKYEYAQGITIARIFTPSTKVQVEKIRMDGYDISPSDYEEIIRNILTYSKAMEKYDYYINDELLPISAEDSILYNIYTNKSKTR